MLFQCSSASRKFLNRASGVETIAGTTCFSALQRAENSSMHPHYHALVFITPFQCSSASRKFLNLQVERLDVVALGVSVLFSEPKIPQSSTRCRMQSWRKVSVLFSEPKIPQSARAAQYAAERRGFQCSSASRKFLNVYSTDRRRRIGDVSVLFSEPKIPQSYTRDYIARAVAAVSVLFSEPKIPQSLAFAAFADRQRQVSVLFSEPKIPQLTKRISNCCVCATFQCSSASRKFLNRR